MFKALFLMTTAVGNLITMVIIEIFSAAGLEQFVEFFTFAGLMTVFSFVLMWVATRCGSCFFYIYFLVRAPLLPELIFGRP